MSSRTAHDARPRILFFSTLARGRAPCRPEPSPVVRALRIARRRSRSQRKSITLCDRVATVTFNDTPIICKAFAAIATYTRVIGSGAMTAVLCASVWQLTAGPSTCDMDAVIGDGGRCKPKPTKDQRLFDGGIEKDIRSLAALPAGANKK